MTLHTMMTGGDICGQCREKIPECEPCFWTTCERCLLCMVCGLKRADVSEEVHERI